MNTSVLASPVSQSQKGHFQDRLTDDSNVTWDDDKHVTFKATADDPVPVTGRVEGGVVTDLVYQDQTGFMG